MSNEIGLIVNGKTLAFHGICPRVGDALLAVLTEIDIAPIIHGSTGEAAATWGKLFSWPWRNYVGRMIFYGIIPARVRGIKLRGQDLSGMSLTGANLVEYDLRETNLMGADLRWACLEDADLRGADLSWAQLWGANLMDAKLTNARLSGAFMDGARMSAGWKKKKRKEELEAT